MAHRRAITAAALLLVSGAGFAGIDLSDFDQNTMQDVEDAGKELDAAIGGKDGRTAVANAEFIRDSLQWAEGYFEKKPDAANAVRLSREGREWAAAILKAAGEGDFDSAGEAYTSLKRTCKSCHDAYKPPKL